MNEQTKTHIEHSREINRLQRSIDNLHRSLEIANALNESYKKFADKLINKIKELQSRIDTHDTHNLKRK
jgi:phage shock protein A